MSFKEAWDGLPAPLKGFAAGVGIVGGVITVITGFAGAVDALDAGGFPIPATRAWVREDNGQIKSLVRVLNEKQTAIQLDNLNGKVESMTALRNKLEIDALNYDPEGKTRAAQEMRRLDETIAALNEQRRAIRGTRGPN